MPLQAFNVVYELLAIRDPCRHILMQRMARHDLHAYVGLVPLVVSVVSLWSRNIFVPFVACRAV